MAKVIEVIRDALGHLRVLDANEAPPAEDTRDAIRALNLMMRAWETDGLALGWSDVDGPDDVLPVPPEAEEVIGYNLALRLRARYGAVLDGDVVAFARDGMATLSAAVARHDFARLSYPDLPHGVHSGSWRDGFHG